MRSNFATHIYIQCISSHTQARAHTPAHIRRHKFNLPTRSPLSIQLTVSFSLINQMHDDVRGRMAQRASKRAVTILFNLSEPLLFFIPTALTVIILFCFRHCYCCCCCCCQQKYTWRANNNQWNVVLYYQRKFRSEHICTFSYFMSSRHYLSHTKIFVARILYSIDYYYNVRIWNERVRRKCRRTEKRRKWWKLEACIFWSLFFSFINNKKREKNV